MTQKQFIYKEWCETSVKWTMRVHYPYGKPKLTRQYAQMSQESINLLRTKQEVLSTMFKPKL